MPVRLLAVAAAVVLCAAPAAAQKKHALLVGVTTYEQPNQLPKLDFCQSDAQVMGELLEEKDHGYEVTVMTEQRRANRTPNPRLRPTKENIDAQLDALLGKYDPVQKKTGPGRVRAGDTVLIGLSGHGVRFPDEPKNYFCPTNAVPKPSQTGTLIAIEDLVERLENCPGEIRLLFVDACRDVVNNPKGKGLADALNHRRGVGVLLSCAAGEKSFEDANLKHGVFFHYVLEAFRGEGVQPGAAVTWNSVCDHVQLRVKAHGNFGQQPAAFGTFVSPPILVTPAAPPLLTGAFPEATGKERQRRWAVRFGKKVEESFILNPLNTANLVGLDLVLIPSGRFTMGSPEPDEAAHVVTIRRPFFVGKTEVTQKQLRVLLKTHKSKFLGDDLPADSVSFDDAERFCQEVSTLLKDDPVWKNYVCRLPTEAEWEYACRAGTDTKFHFGDQLSARNANCRAEVWEKKPLKVSEYRENPFGLRDMHGNVAEWVADWFAAYSGREEIDPTGPVAGDHRILRGGHYNSETAGCRSAARFLHKATNPTPSFAGFRVVIAAK